MYDRALDFDGKIDSVGYLPGILKMNQELDFKKEMYFPFVSKDIFEMRNDYDSAINYYYKSLEARRLQYPEYETSALGDLAMAYSN